ncbi:MAG: hybrid sensor histidine kinase/response regulator, partial [Verrucomicrobiota bacterium]
DVEENQIDIMMPGISGLEVLKTLRETYTLAQLPIIMVTAKNASENVVEALEMGANDYVTKPIDMPVLLARVAAQMELLRLTQERDSLLKMKDEFLSIASHDLKNPLTAVMGLAMVVQELMPPGATMTQDTFEFIERIMSSCQTMQNIIEDFLDFQAMEDGRLKLNPAQMDLNALTDKVAKENHDYAKGKNQSLEYAYDENLPMVMADERRLSQVLQNFIGNAIKFGPEGNVITIRTWLSEDGTKAIMESSDQGPGLKEDDLKNMFQKYARLSNRPTGGEKSSGLGLAICKQLMEQHGGEIGVYNNDGKGCTFWFSLPVVTEEAASEPESESEAVAG